MRIHVQQLLTLVLVVGTIMPGAGAYGVSQTLNPAGILVSMNLLLMGGSLVTLAVTSITTPPPRV